MSEHNQPKTSGSVVTSDMARTSRHHRSRFWLVFGAVAAVVVAGSLGAIIWMRHMAPPRTDSAITQTTGADQLNIALQAAQAKVAAARTPADKATAYNDLGTAYFNKSQYGAAVDAYKAAVAADASAKAVVLPLLAYTYAISGQRDKAIATYQELVKTLQAQPTDTEHAGQQGWGDAIATYQHDIGVLQRGGSL